MIWGYDVISRHAGPVRYDEVGDGPPLLLVGSGGWAEFRSVLGDFAEFYRCLVPNGPFDDVIERLRLGTVDILGYGAGARAAMDYAVAHSDRVGKLVIVAPEQDLPVRHVPVPTLLTWGRADPVYPALIDAIPDAELHVFGNCGRAVVDDQPEAFANTALAFLLRKTSG